MSFLNLQGETFLIAGVANKKSVASHVAQILLDEGARCIFTVQSESHLESTKKIFPNSPVIICDVSKEDDLKRLPDEVAKHAAELNGLLHSLAYANFSDGVKPFHETKRADFLEATQISSFSLVEMTNVLRPLLAPHSSVVTISISNTRATSYGYLGPIKAMLDTTVAYLAKSLSELGVRVNAVGAGPLKTSASAGIPDYVDNYLFAEALTLRKVALTTQEVASAAVFLLSEKSSGINATTMLVDAGMSCNYFDQSVVKAFNR